MKPLSEQIRELEEHGEQLQRELEAQLALNREILSNEDFYRERQAEFLRLLAAKAADETEAAAPPVETFKIHGRTLIAVTPAMIRGVNWN